MKNVFAQESLSLPNTPRSSFKESVRNSLRKLKRGRKTKQEKKGEERMRKKGRRGDFEVEVALTEEKEELSLNLKLLVTKDNAEFSVPCSNSPKYILQASASLKTKK